MPDIEFEFHAQVSDVRERFQKRYDPQKAGEAKSEAQFSESSDEVSTGWYVSLATYGIAIYFGKTKPAIEKGDTLVLHARRIPKTPPALEVVPPSPPAIDPAAAGAAFLESLPPEQREKVLEAISQPTP